MKYTLYTVVQEEKLASIAQKHNTTPEKIKALNPSMRTFSGFIGGEFVFAQQRIKIPNKEEIVEQTETYSDTPLDTYVFNSRARYRCEQINNTKVNNTLTSYTNQKKQYLLEQNLEKGYAKILLEEFLYEVIPPALSSSFELVKSTEFIKNNAYFKLSEKGKIEKILNSTAILKKWKEFKEIDFNKLPFIVSLKNNSESVKNIEKAGDKQFSCPNIQEYQRNLFNFLCFDQYLYNPIDELEKEEFLYASTLLPPVVIPLVFRYNKVRENKNLQTIKKIAEVKLSENLIQELTVKYNEMLKPAIKYSFTEYKLFFSCIIELDKETKLLEKASVSLKEEIADNIENTCEFSLNRLHNYTPQ